MHIIPVIDLRGHRVVRAVRGQREQYRPLESRLCAGSDPVTVARAMLSHCRARVLYIADLDALTGGPAQAGTLRDLCRALPGHELWLDAGFTDGSAATALLATLAGHGAHVRPVFGSESLAPANHPFDSHPDAILSLDRRHGAPLGHAGWWDSPHAWPGTVIVMALDRVGAFEGPDLDLLAGVRDLAGPSRTLVGAGGVRDSGDLEQAAASGAQAWLVASALHDLRLAPATA